MIRIIITAALSPVDVDNLSNHVNLVFLSLIFSLNLFFSLLIAALSITSLIWATLNSEIMKVYRKCSLCLTLLWSRRIWLRLLTGEKRQCNGKRESKIWVTTVTIYFFGYLSCWFYQNEKSKHIAASLSLQAENCINRQQAQIRTVLAIVQLHPRWYLI